MSLKLELFTAIALLSFEPPTEAHDIYSHLMNGLGGSCCNEKDCRPAPYRMTADRGANVRRWRVDRCARLYDPVSSAAR